jgi:hypothetical protein
MGLRVYACHHMAGDIRRSRHCGDDKFVEIYNPVNNLRDPKQNCMHEEGSSLGP